MSKNKVPETHPSFGMINISRVSGQARLFDSPFEHQHYIKMTISRADRTRGDLHETSIDPNEQLIEVGMSETQFAHLITTFNMHQGTPCTISRLDGKIVNEPPADKTKEHFAHEAREHFTHLAEMSQELEKLTNLSPKDVKADQRERMRFLSLKIHQELTGNIDFFHERFQESMDKVVVSAKAEIQAHVMNMIQKTGLESLSKTWLALETNLRDTLSR